MMAVDCFICAPDAHVGCVGKDAWHYRCNEHRGLKLQTWDHQRKGRIRGYLLDGNDTWIDVHLLEEDAIRLGEDRITVRRAFLTEVTS